MGIRPPPGQGAMRRALKGRFSAVPAFRARFSGAPEKTASRPGRRSGIARPWDLRILLLKKSAVGAECASRPGRENAVPLLFFRE